MTLGFSNGLRDLVKVVLAELFRLSSAQMFVSIRNTSSCLFKEREVLRTCE
jgi:hypothetical protein